MFQYEGERLVRKKRWVSTSAKSPLNENYVPTDDAIVLSTPFSLQLEEEAVAQDDKLLCIIQRKMKNKNLQIKGKISDRN